MSKDWLAEIVANKRREIAVRIEEVPVGPLRERALARGAAPPDFLASLGRPTIGLIAEVKRRSPSAGPIREPFDPVAIAKAYEQAGAQAISVLMDDVYFGGGASDFRLVRAAVALPLLYKEFVIDPWQIWHAADLGASAILLIAGVLDQRELETMMSICREARLAPLVEVHNRDELTIALSAHAPCIGINNRDLKTFVTSLDTTFALNADIPDSVRVISESGISTAEDVQRLRAAGVGGVLVGEHLLRQPDPGVAVTNLMGAAWACL